MSLSKYFQKKNIYILILLVFIINIGKVVFNTYQMMGKEGVLSAEVDNLDRIKGHLQEELGYKTGALYVEQLARDKLNLVKPGEVLYVFNQSSAEDTSGEINIETEGKYTVPEMWTNLIMQGLSW
jgi:hypothetical protein